ncbi:MAG: ABC transporter ATP-binding protein [SAR202 cluster bacterium]|nr:ABC transporter ATP-binding protein [SAR202 cluster bacterium]MDP6798663.1 ABC transporter ATP-binding protein [SAR202 cluster bacterium]
MNAKTNPNHDYGAPQALEVRDLRFAYNNRPVLDGFNFRAAKGELVGLVGPNGTGKTTLLRLLSGVLRPLGGSVMILGEETRRMPTSERARLVSVVPQDPRTPMGLTAFDLVLLGRNPHLGLLQWEGRRDAEIAMHSMALTGTDDLAQRRFENLSGGEKQRVLIALALAQQVPVMLLDEPTSNLDIAHQPAVMELLADLKREAKGAVVVAMHDLTLAAQFCDRIVIIHKGRNFAEGPPAKVLTEQNIEAVYGTKVRVMSHPDTGMPVVVSARSGGVGSAKGDA